MGCDGGTIPRRDELVRVKKKPEQVCINGNCIPNMWRQQVNDCGLRCEATVQLSQQL